eukprot:7482662-Pyramimonas_sp.AAC.1
MEDDEDLEGNEAKQRRIAAAGGVGVHAAAAGGPPFDPWGDYRGPNGAAPAVMPLGPPPAVPPPAAIPEGLDPGAARLFTALSADFRNVMGETIKPLDAK